MERERKKTAPEEDETRKCLKQYQIDRISNNFKAVEMCEQLTWYGIHEWQSNEEQEKKHVVEVKLLVDTRKEACGCPLVNHTLCATAKICQYFGNGVCIRQLALFVN